MGKSLESNPVHLGLGAKATSEPAFSGMEWYAEYGARHRSDGAEGRLISMHSFSSPWTSWEMHPHGDEVVLCVSGELTLIQDINGSERRTKLSAGEYAINPAGVWHTADTHSEAKAVFITAGMGTQHRSR